MMVSTEESNAFNSSTECTVALGLEMKVGRLARAPASIHYFVSYEKLLMCISFLYSNARGRSTVVREGMSNHDCED